MCLHHIPGRRYSSAKDLADDLERWLDDEPITARRESLSERGRRWVRLRRRTAVTTIVAAATVAMVSLVILVILQAKNNLELQRRQRKRAGNLGPRSGSNRDISYRSEQGLLVERARIQRTSQKPAEWRTEFYEKLEKQLARRSDLKSKVRLWLMLTTRSER